MPDSKTAEHSDSGLLKSAASAIGGALGAVAAVVTPGTHQQNAEKPHTPRRDKNGRFVKTNKARLPRRTKKEEAKKKIARVA